MRVLNLAIAGTLVGGAIASLLLVLLMYERGTDDTFEIVVLSVLTGLILGGVVVLVAMRFVIRRRLLRRQRLEDRASRQSQLSQYEILFEGICAQLKFQDSNVTQICRADPQQNNDVRALFVTSNGGGLGHVSRTLAVAAEWEGEVRFLTMSKGYSLISAAGYHGLYLPSHENQGISRQQWGTILTRCLWKELIEQRPALVMFDGAAVYPELRTVTRLAGVPLIWLRRGLWKASIRDRSHQYNLPQGVCDYLIEPGDLSLGDSGSAGIRRGTNNMQFSVPPIVSLGPDQFLSREAALKDLGWKDDIKYVLIQLGAGNINDIQDAENIVAAAVKELGEDWEPIIARSPIASTDNASEWPVITRYPLATHFRAFEFGVISGGYNSIQEAISCDLPTVAIPNLHTLTDDQATRVTQAAQRGLLLEAVDLTALKNAVSVLADNDYREGMRQKLAQIPSPTGAPKVVQTLMHISTSLGAAEPLYFE